MTCSFSDAPQHGDRFPFFLNYVERDPQFVVSHFGLPMAEGVFALEADDSRWHGPFESGSVGGGVGPAGP